MSSLDVRGRSGEAFGVDEVRRRHLFWAVLTTEAGSTLPSRNVPEDWPRGESKSVRTAIGAGDADPDADSVDIIDTSEARDCS